MFLFGQSKEFVDYTLAKNKWRTEQNFTQLSALKGTFSFQMFTVQNTVEKIFFLIVHYLQLAKAEEITGNKLIVLFNVDIF